WGLFAPYLAWGRVDVWVGSYMGAVPLLLVLWGLPTFSRRGERSTRPLALFALGLFVLATWVSLGSHGKLYYLLTQVPVVGNFRAPARYNMIATFALMVLAALAFGRLAAAVRTGQQMPARWLVLPWTAVLVSAGLAIYCAAAGSNVTPGRIQQYF